MFSLRNSLLFSAVKFFFQLVGIVLFRPVNLHNLFGRKYFSEFIIILLTHIQYLTTLGKTSFYLLLHLGIRCKVLGKAPAQRRAKVAGTIYRIRVKAHFAERIGKAVKNARPGMDQCSINIK